VSLRGRFSDGAGTGGIIEYLRRQQGQGSAYAAAIDIAFDSRERYGRVAIHRKGE